MSLTKEEIEKAQEAIKFLSSITPPDAAQTGVSLARPCHPNVSRRADSLASETSHSSSSSNTDRCEYNCQICNLCGVTRVIMLIDNFATPHYNFIHYYTTLQLTVFGECLVLIY